MKSFLINFLIVGSGGFLGAASRFSIYYLRQTYLSFLPIYFATFFVNILGSFLIGLVLGHYSEEVFESPVRLFFITGILGGFTTFSGFSNENLQLIQSGKHIEFLSYIVLSIVFGVVFAYLGFRLSR